MGLADEILEVAATVGRRPTWWDRLPAEATSELLDVRHRFQAGEYGELKRHQLGELLFTRCKARGWRTCDARRLAEWLAKND